MGCCCFLNLFCFVFKQVKRSVLVLEKLLLLSAEEGLGDDETRNKEISDSAAVFQATNHEDLSKGQSSEPEKMRQTQTSPRR